MGDEPKAQQRSTREVSAELFREVYDSPASLPGTSQWVTPEEDVRELERVLGIPAGTIGVPLWVSGDHETCPKCGRKLSWLDIVKSGLRRRHSPARIAEVILSDRKYVNTEAPHAVPDVHCANCGSPISDIRSFKCHNWAYAFGEIQEIVAAAEAEQP